MVGDPQHRGDCFCVTEHDKHPRTATPQSPPASREKENVSEIAKKKVDVKLLQKTVCQVVREKENACEFTRKKSGVKLPQKTGVGLLERKKTRVKLLERKWV